MTFTHHLYFRRCCQEVRSVLKSRRPSIKPWWTPWVTAKKRHFHACTWIQNLTKFNFFFNSHFCFPVCPLSIYIFYFIFDHLCFVLAALYFYFWHLQHKQTLRHPIRCQTAHVHNPRAATSNDPFHSSTFTHFIVSGWRILLMRRESGENSSGFLFSLSNWLKWSSLHASLGRKTN